ncbi:hypothetical protein ABZU45_07015 [Streptomyces avermitilis]|uniref:hypothetical protein n=1 Tax=Streptomyces avermitilis TaxID=33903 RepID=UPI0033A48A56
MNASPRPRLPTDPPLPSLLRRPHRLLPTTLALLLAAALLAAVHHARPAPYGDRLTVHARVAPAVAPRLRMRGAAVEAYGSRGGAVHWTYARAGRRPLAVLPARRDAIALWDDGLVTATDATGVRWHRALPAAADWLAAHGGAGVLRMLDPGTRMLAVVTPHRIAAYRLADGDLRWVLPARPGCAFAPARAVHRGRTILIAQPCPAADSWSGEIVAVDALGPIAPRRTPLGNEGQGEHHSAEHPHTGNLVARPR